MSERFGWCIPHQAFDQERRDGISSSNFFLTHLVTLPLEDTHDILESTTRGGVLGPAVIVVLVRPIHDAPAVVWIERCTFNMRAIFRISTVLQTRNHIGGNTVGVLPNVECLIATSNVTVFEV